MQLSTIEELQKIAITKIGEEKAIWLLSALLNKNRSELLLNLKMEIPASRAKLFSNWLERAQKGEPLQYIANESIFFGRSFYVDNRVLIPRPESETMVEHILQMGDLLGPDLNVLDVGTGSGNIAITLKLERPNWNLFASDKDLDALEVAKKNGLDLEAPIEFRQSDLLEGWKSQNFDLIVSNPPYLDKNLDEIQKDVMEWEPMQALIAADEGAKIADILIEQSVEKAPKAILFELSERVIEKLALKWKPNKRIHSFSSLRDLNQRERFLKILFY